MVASRLPGVSLLVVAIAMGGCLSPASTLSDADAGASPAPRVVVAFVDSGVNFFHQSFRHQTSAPAFADAVPLSFSPPRDYASAVEDFPWDAVAPGTLYWVEGTRILTITFGEFFRPDEPIRPVEHRPLLDDYAHGTGVGQRILQHAPEAWLVSVEASEENVSTALRWIADQPWIDVVSLSVGSTANAFLPVRDSYAPLTHEIVRQGKVVFDAAGNDPTVTLLDDYDGPPWVIGVGGARNETRGWSVIGSRPMDVVSNYRIDAARHDQLEGETWYAGTSFATPTVAGALAQVILELRRTSGHVEGIQEGLLVPPLGLGHADLREALNATATYWAPEDYDPVGGIREPISSVLWMTAPNAPPAGPVGPWLQVGWGFVNASTVAPMVDLLSGGPSPPPKPPEAHTYMDLVQQAREARWPPP